ncbi:MAG: elongation factor P maturation arginine rhamnosyltransferase EarP [Telluria sp.]
MRGIRSVTIFCKVVDNFGDIGICWRMARQMAREHALAVTLFVDDLHSFARIAPRVDERAPVQALDGVTVRRWRLEDDAFTQGDVTDLVIEFFGVELPGPYQQAMALRHPKPVWINYEGLSAEGWVEGCHQLPSMHPRLPLTKHFFFPGFTPKTGGLLCEAGLTEERAAFDGAAWLARLGLAQREIDGFKVSLFCYPHAPVEEAFAQWKEGADAVTCLVPEGVARDPVRRFLGADPVAGAVRTDGALTVRVVPFLPQEEYDHLLWSCDFNIVRGEDSFVRAQWAARPFAWHIYPQDENLHHTKLRAFLQRYAAPDDALSRYALVFNRAEAGALPWNAVRAAYPELCRHAAAWARDMAALGDAVGNLLAFARRFML